ncbi:helitron_like_N domain-containing protein [Trichonephila inaurata madagascariensis]|uniref:Helitron_like_N domain-containing protein n=1 Tax=Trichonephila inaurata madagascariensis TaxID=2747483 RepID=A0A8X6JBK3_9ARAC|nr:helitron_like_N domain-containing protein [Trichonephila inaurata madagascariensis]
MLHVSLMVFAQRDTPSNLDTTAENIDGYPIYRRCDNANHIVINGNVVDNRWIVPYNPYLTKKYNAHINMEICSSIKSICKYVYKGHN